MKTDIKIAVIGGTGKAGKYLIKQLAGQNIPFNVLVRNPENFNSFGADTQIIMGNAANYEDILSLLNGCDAVISMLGMGVSPNPANIFSTATSNIIRAMQECDIKRYIMITGLNVNTPYDNKGEKSKMATGWMLTHYPDTTRDKQLEYEILAQSETDWTMIRLPMIEQTDIETTISISIEDCPGDTISTTSLAKFVISQIDNKEYCRRAPFIANV